MKNLLATFPRWTFSIIWIIILAWLMIVPSAFMEKLTDMVATCDKECHVISAAIMIILICFDWQRKHKYSFVSMSKIGIFAFAGTMITALFEYLQTFTPEEYRRWFDVNDILFQIVGAVAAALLYYFLQRLWVRKPDYGLGDN